MHNLRKPLSQPTLPGYFLSDHFSCPPLTGATGPLLPYWDPLGMGQKRPDKFQRWRAVEIKHGRIAMMATLGAQANPSRLSKATTAWLLSQRRC